MKTVWQIHACSGDKVVYSKTYYSIGGGFIVDEEHFGQRDAASEVSVPYPFKSATETAGATAMKPAIRFPAW